MDAETSTVAKPWAQRAAWVGNLWLGIAAGTAGASLLLHLGQRSFSDYQDARGVTWTLPSVLELIDGLCMLTAFGGGLIGFLLRVLSRIPRDRRALLMMGLSGCGFLGAFLTLLPLARPNYPTDRCLNNQEEIATAASIYSQDNGERLPTRFSDLDPYVDPAVLICPSSKRAFHGKMGYGLNGHMTGRALDSIPDHSRVMLTADSIRPGMLITSCAEIDSTRHAEMERYEAGGESRQRENPRRPRGYVVGFVDGHVSFCTSRHRVAFK